VTTPTTGGCSSARAGAVSDCCPYSPPGMHRVCCWEAQIAEARAELAAVTMERDLARAECESFRAALVDVLQQLEQLDHPPGQGETDRHQAAQEHDLADVGDLGIGGQGQDEDAGQGDESGQEREHPAKDAYAPVAGKGTG